MKRFQQNLWRDSFKSQKKKLWQDLWRDYYIVAGKIRYIFWGNSGCISGEIPPESLERFLQNLWKYSCRISDAEYLKMMNSAELLERFWPIIWKNVDEIYGEILVECLKEKQQNVWRESKEMPVESLKTFWHNLWRASSRIFEQNILRGPDEIWIEYSRISGEIPAVSLEETLLKNIWRCSSRISGVFGLNSISGLIANLWRDLNIILGEIPTKSLEWFL